MASQDKKPRIVERYDEFQPALSYASRVAEVLESLPPHLLRNLEAVVLRDTASLSRSERKIRGRSGDRRVPLAEARGRYRSSSSRGAAFIELYLDNILSDWPPWFRWIPVIRYEIVHSVLFHELGHHLQASPKQVLGQSEHRADQLAICLSRQSFRRRHPFLVPLVRLGRRLLQGVQRVRRASDRPIR